MQIKQKQDSINQTDIEVKYIEADIARYKVDNAKEGGDDENVNDNNVIENSKLRIAERKQTLEEDKFSHTKTMDNKNYKLDVKKANTPNKK